MKKTLIASAIAAVAVAPMAHAEVKISGQVHQAVILSSDLDDINIVDNNHSGSRFRFVASKEVGSLKIGTRYELQAVDNNSTTGEDALIQEVRVSDVYVSGAFGKLGIGKGAGAADGTFESHGLLGHYLAQDLTWLAVNSSLNEGNKIAYRSVDGLSRQNRIRYDSPNFGGFKFKFSLDNGGKTEVAGAYNGKIGGGKLRVRAGVTSADDDAQSRTSYSAAYKTGFGLGVAASYGENDTGFDSNWLNLTYQIGKVTLSYGTGDDSNDNEMNVIGAIYNPVKGVNVYLNTVSATNADGAEPDATYLGFRAQF